MVKKLENQYIRKVLKKNSDITKAVYKSAKDLHEIGIISDSEMQEFKIICNKRKKFCKKTAIEIIKGKPDKNKKVVGFLAN